MQLRNMRIQSIALLFVSVAVAGVSALLSGCTAVTLSPDQAVAGVLDPFVQDPVAEDAASQLPSQATAQLQNQRENSAAVPDSSVLVHRISMGPSNAYLLETEQGLILVDAGLPYSEGLVLRKMEEIGRDDLRLIFVTHAHIDHYGAANALREETGALVAIHPDDAATMAEGRTDLGTVRDWERTSDATLPYIEPLLSIVPTEADILLEDGDSLEEYGIDAYVLHTPGHTPGSSTLMVDDRYAFAGDLVASNGGLHAQRSFAFDWPQVARSIRRLKSLNPELVFPGHGKDPITGEELSLVDARFVDEVHAGEY